MRRFFAPAKNFTKTHVTLDEAETRHLRDVLRLRVGDEVYVIDGEGSEYRCGITSIGKRVTELAIFETAAPAVLALVASAEPTKPKRENAGSTP